MKNIFISLIVFIPFLSTAQWNINQAINTPVCVRPYDQQDVRIVSDGKSGAIMAWQDFRNDATQSVSDIYVQRINSAGFASWTANGVALCTHPSDQLAPAINEDGKGGAIIVWGDARADNGDIYAQKIDSLGNILWAANGVPVVAKTKLQQNAKLISDGAEGAIVVWQDSAATLDIYAQRISSNGAQLWATGGIVICNAGNTQANPRIETDGAGGAIIVWQDKRNGADYDIYAQRINASGVVQWAANGIYVNSVVGTESNPKIEPDGSGGAIIAWQDKRNGLNYDVFAQRVNASGARLWTTNGVAVCTAAGSQSAVDITSEGVNGVIISWKDERSVNNIDIYAQKLDLNGAPAWTVNGIAVTNTAYSQLNPNIVGDGSGGAIIAWQDSSAGTWDIYSAKINSAGTILWKMPVGIASNHQVSPKNISDGTGGSIYAWPDSRTGSSDIYAHRILSSGLAASIKNLYPLFFNLKAYPNPFREETTIPAMGKEIKIYTSLGKEVVPQLVHTPDSFVIRRGDLSTGLYFFNIKTSNGINGTGHFIITD